MRRLLPLLLLLLTVVACKTNPHTGRSQLILFSDAEMKQLGVQAYAEMTGPQSNARIVTDPVLTAPLLRVGAAISKAAEKPDYEWEFRLIDDPKTANAWALPGGKIAFYTGIYPILKDEAGMAVVMGHEVMHAILEHGNERMSQQAAANVGLTIVGVSLENNKHREEILAGLGVLTTGAILLPYSRTHESEADKQGLFLAAKAGYDPEAAIGVWERMAELSKGNRPPEILSTHPDPERRIANMRKWMPEAMRYYEAAPVKHDNRPLPMPR